jgi:molybdopterin-binding protein
MKRYEEVVALLPAWVTVAYHQNFRRIIMPLSARNHLKGEVTEVLLGTVTALVVVKVGDEVIESVITRHSAEELKLKKGDRVTAVIKATEVMIQKD